MLAVNAISKVFGGTTAATEVSFHVTAGHITSLIGPNGAGKTTILNILTGLVAPDNGAVMYGKQYITGLSPWAISRLGISRTFQDVKLCREMTTLENVLLALRNQPAERLMDALLLFSRSSGTQRSNVVRAMALLDNCALTHQAHTLVEHLSYGQQKLLTICCCLATEPKLLLLDEPVAGVQPATIERLAALIREVVSDGSRGILLVEHDLQFVNHVSDRIIVVDQGRVVAAGTPDEIASKPAVVEAYLS